MSKTKDLVEHTLGKYMLRHRLRGNKFYEVYMAADTGKTGSNEPVEVRVADMSTGFNVKLLEYETKVRKELAKNDYLFKLITSATQGNFSYSVCEHSGYSIGDLYNSASYFSMQTIVLTIYELLGIIEKVHKEKFLLRCITPENVGVGTGDRAKSFFILDLYWFKKFWDPRTNKHIPCIEGKPLLKDPIYASSHEHLGLESSRRDDLESLSYFALFMFVGNLPWTENVLNDNPKENFPIIASKKLNISPESLFMGFPYQFSVMLKYAKGLKFDEVPDYEWLRGLFSDLFNTLNYKISQALDWVKDNPGADGRGETGEGEGDEEEDDIPEK